MNIIKWVINKKKIEEELENQDMQYSELMMKYGKLETLCEVLQERNDVLEEEHSKQIETIGKLRKKYNELKKEVKASETNTH